jgi:hypothetical protein
MIEGNRLDPDQVEKVLMHHGHFPGRERDEHEVKGYYAALNQVEKWAAQGVKIRKLDPKQRKALQLFQEFETITSRQIAELFGFKPRTSSAICESWVESGFITIVDASNKKRKYKLSAMYESLIQ